MKDNKGKTGRVLLVYPNPEGYGGIPNGLALLSGCLNDAGFETKCFDTTFHNSPPKTLFYREKHGGMMHADHEDFWGGWQPELAKKVPELFIDAIDDFKPDLIAISIVDVSYVYAMSLLKKIAHKLQVPVVAGGITVTLNPEMVIENDFIDAVCIGEGEDALVEFAENVVAGKDYSKIKNMWVKNKNGKITKSPLRPLKNMDGLSFQDWTIFDKRHYYKPYCGSFRRTGFFELARGCHYNCSFCCTANLRKIYKGLGKFVRTRSIDSTFDEITFIKNEYELELIFFIDDNFLGMPEDRFDYFCEQYQKRINLPFYIQTRAETVNEEYIRKLKDINISTIGIGVEHGDEEFRKKYMNRRMNNEELHRAFDIVHKFDIRSTANVILGMPGEDETMVQDTIELLRELKPKSVSINYFMPYRGTRMREIAIEEGYIPEDHIIIDSNTCLDMPKFRKERLKHYYENFSKYLDGELNLAEAMENAKLRLERI